MLIFNIYFYFFLLYYTYINKLISFKYLGLNSVLACHNKDLNSQNIVNCKHTTGRIGPPSASQQHQSTRYNICSHSTSLLMVFRMSQLSTNRLDYITRTRTHEQFIYYIFL